ncbi:MAG: cyanophycinase [Cytophagales bacterium]|nr:cyanophycinase [Cytophagales bacterium]
MIDNKNANTQAIYDSLQQYDVIFFKGGDQSRYYDYYNNTKTEESVWAKYQSGGVICGTSAGLHILSGVDYTAEGSSVDPSNALGNINTNLYTLKKDFLPFQEGYLFDSHFSERGRVGRLVPMLARWYKDEQEALTGIGIDDLSAMGIANDTGYVFGTGAAHLFIPKAEGFSFSSNTFSNDSIIYRALLNGWKYSFSKDSVIVPSEVNNHSYDPELFPLDVWASVYVSNSSTTNGSKSLLDTLAKRLDSSTPVLIFGGKAATQLTNWKTAMEERGFSNIALTNSGAVHLKQLFQQARLVIFLQHSSQEIKEFKESDVWDVYLKKTKNPNFSIAFAGEDVRFAGSFSVSDNYTEEYTAYDGLLTSNPALSAVPGYFFFPGSFLPIYQKKIPFALFLIFCAKIC